MNFFTGQLVLRSLSAYEIRLMGRDVQIYRSMQDYAYTSDKLGGKQVVVPAGFQTDFASIPRFAWSLIDPEDIIIAHPSYIHDFLYSMRGTLTDGFTYTREQADGVLREAMELCGASSIMRETVYDAVRNFGQPHWDQSP